MTLDEAIEQMTIFVADLNDARDVTDIPSIMAMKATLTPILAAMEQAKARIAELEVKERVTNLMNGFIATMTYEVPIKWRFGEIGDVIVTVDKGIRRVSRMFAIESMCHHKDPPRMLLNEVRQALAALDKEAK